MSQADIFRKVAVDRLSSPEQLDQLMHITTPRSWATLASVGVLLAVAVSWSFVGSLPERVTGQAILLRSGGVREVASQSDGRVADLSVQPGDTISEGSVIARLAQPALSNQVRQAREQVAELDAAYQRARALANQDAQLQDVALAQRRTNAQQSIAASQRLLATLREKIEAEQQLVSRGLLTRQTLLATQAQADEVRDKIRQDSTSLVQLGVDRLQAQSQQQQQLTANWNQLSSARRTLAGLESDLAIQTTIASPYSGRVLELMSEQGSLASRGTPLLSLSLEGSTVSGLQAVVYVPSVHGKKLHPGMTIEISPSTVREEEFGHLLGRVTYVSAFPATSQGMLRVLKNPTLVATLSGQDAPYEVHAELVPDTASPSGYRWSSSKGPAVRVQSGTLGSATIVVSRKRPILYVIPQLGRLLSDDARPPRPTAPGSEAS